MIPRILHLVFLSSFILGVCGSNDTSICSVCSCSGITINCRSKKLNHAFEEALWQKLQNSSYKEANFENNHIGHLTRFPPLPLVNISFKNNNLVKVDDRAFKYLVNLRELDLSQNKLTSDNLVPAVFEGPHDPMYYQPLNLTLLDLSSNELHTLHQDLFEHVPWLERLYLKQNPFKILDKSTIIAISSLPNLQILDLSYTKIKKLPEGFLHTPRKLHELVLRGNYFQEVPMDVLAESHALRILNLNENPIKVLSKERPFPEMPYLKQLHISFMPNLTRIEEGSLSGLINLSYLYCRMNEQLTYISPRSFKNGWPIMARVDLSDNNIRYFDEEFKWHWNKTKHINILGNPLVCDCENQWIVSDLVPYLISSANVEGLECAEPSPMKGQRLVSLYAKNYTMRCLDLYGNHPENDGPILVGIFVTIIICLLIILGAVVWLKNNNTCRPNSRANYHRAFYRPSKQDSTYVPRVMF